jgi:hypothetical protein
VVVSNDSDLQGPVAVVKHDLGIVVGIVNPDASARRSALQVTSTAGSGSVNSGPAGSRCSPRRERQDLDAGRLVGLGKAKAARKRPRADHRGSRWVCAHGSPRV